MDNKIAQKELKFYDYLFLDTEVSFDALKKFFTNKVKKIKKKEREYEGIWKFINNFKIKDSFSEELKITMAVVFIIISAVWIGDRSAIPVAHSDESEMTNAHVKETIDIKEKEIESNEKKVDVKAAIEYKLESSEKSCEKDKEEKKSSILCGKDDEEKVKEIEKEKKKEMEIKAMNSRPKAVRLSCREDDYGDPSKSNNKGKHMDEDCCPDPDEWPKPGCVYDSKGYSIMIKGPRK